ncbi:MAG: hypothetical protein ACREMG_13740, partial [Gemmatimonadales bacterium]
FPSSPPIAAPPPSPELLQRIWPDRSHPGSARPAPSRYRFRREYTHALEQSCPTVPARLS